MTALRRLLGRPALHFVLVGGLAFAAHGWLSRAASPAAAPPAAAPARTDEELLLEEALALDLDRRDRLVRDRLAGLVRLAEAGDVEDVDDLAREARRLGLERHDVVVRRHLVQMMALALARGGRSEPPSEELLAAYLEHHPERFVQPARVRLRHVFFARDRAGRDPRAAAREALAALAPARDAPAGMGDGFLAGRELAGSERELSRVFGPAFVAELARLPLGRWSGPLASPYGWHVVRVDERTSETLPPVAAVRARLVEAVRAEQAAERLARRLAELRARDRAGRS